MRRALPFAIVAGCGAIGVLPAFAANQTVEIHDSFYSPGVVAVLPGETVTWDGQGSLMHSVHFEGEVDPVAPPSSKFSGSRQFDAEGVFRYYCDVHGFMRGTVHVNQTGTVPTPDPTASPTASATPPPPPPTTGDPPPGAPAARVTAFRARATKARFCTRRSARCKRPGVFLTLDIEASESVRVRGTLRRGARRVRTVTLRGRPGRHRVRLPGRALKAGRYALALRAGELSRVVRFRVRRV